MSVIRWEEPPPALAERSWVGYSHELIALQLKRRPGEWGVIAETPGNVGMATQINAGKLRPYRPAGSFEAVARNKNGVYAIYARYVGEAL